MILDPSLCDEKKIGFDIMNEIMNFISLIAYRLGIHNYEIAVVIEAIFHRKRRDRINQVFFSVIVIVAAATSSDIVRKHEINEGFLVTGLLFPLTLPPTIPLWQVGVGIAFALSG